MRLVGVAMVGSEADDPPPPGVPARYDHLM
jgi:hypothetical protein